MGLGAAARTHPRHPHKGPGKLRPMLERMAKSDASVKKAEPREEVAAVWVDIASLHRWKDNPRRNDKAIPKVVESIRRFGFAAPIIARKADGEIIAGHTRLAAAEALGLTRVPVRYMDLDPADARLLALADNKLNEVAEWDTGAVARILSEYGLEDAALAGWDAAELDKMAAEMTGDRTMDPLDEDRTRASSPSPWSAAARRNSRRFTSG